MTRDDLLKAMRQVVASDWVKRDMDALEAFFADGDYTALARAWGLSHERTRYRMARAELAAFRMLFGFQAQPQPVRQPAPSIAPDSIWHLGLGVRCQNTLERNGVTTIGQVEAMTDAELLRLPEMGRKSVDEIRDALGDYVLHNRRSLIDPQRGG